MFYDMIKRGTIIIYSSINSSFTEIYRVIYGGPLRFLIESHSGVNHVIHIYPEQRIWHIYDPKIHK